MYSSLMSDMYVWGGTNRGPQQQTSFKWRTLAVLLNIVRYYVQLAAPTVRLIRTA